MALIVAVGGAGTMMAVSAAERTAHAYGEYLERAEVGDLVINPSMNTREISAVIHALPGIERITSDVLFQTTLDGGDPRTRQQVDQGGGSDTYVFGSSDGRYVDMDRPILVEGRMPTGSNTEPQPAGSATISTFTVSSAFSSCGLTSFVSPWNSGK